MKKLIALMFCLAVMATVARAQQVPAKIHKKPNAQTRQQAMEKALDLAVLRKATLEIFPADLPSHKANGEAVLMGFANLGKNNAQAIYMATRDLQNEVVDLDADVMKGRVVKGLFRTEGTINFQSVNEQGTNLIKIVMPIKLQGESLKRAKQVTMLNDKEAVQMAKVLQGTTDKATKRHMDKVIVEK